MEIPHLRQLATRVAVLNGDEIQLLLRSGLRPRGLLLLRGAVLSSATGDAIGGLISISLDRVQALKNLARGEAAKESERLRTRMIDSITHQLRAPLASIRRATAMLLSRDALLGGTQDLLTTVYQESDDIDKLVAEATEMARLDAQQVQMHFVSVDVSRFLEEAIRTCSWVRDSHPIVFQVPSH